MKGIISRFVILALAGSVVGLSGCDSSVKEDIESISKTSSSTLVKSFALRSNPKVMAHLDSVFFSIDQVRGEIFNADSLPWGTDVRKLVVNINIPNAGSVELIMPKLSDGTDTIIDLKQTSGDSINFSHGRVWLRVGSENAEYERVYSVKVNVHQCNADSLQWSAEKRTLPGTLPAPLAQRAVELNGKYYSLMQNASEIQLSTSADPDLDSWETAQVGTLPADIKVGSLTASTDALYVLSESGSVFSSTDGLNWQSVQSGWSHIYGAIGSELVGVNGSRWVTYPGGLSGEIDPEMPVSGTSQMWTYTNEWALGPQAIFVGGRKASGALSGQAWGFDGQSWVRLSGLNGRKSLPDAEDYVVFPYFTFRTNEKTYFTNRQSAWFAFGGKKADGTMLPDVYVSLDNGLNWLRGVQGVQLPAEIAPRYGASVLLVEKTFTSRAVKPITEWNAPYVHLYGGFDASGKLYDQTWIGIINRLTFKPLQ